MIFTIIAMNPKGELLPMQLSDPYASGINVKNVKGISPADADIFSTEFAMLDGGIYNGSRVPSRQITLTLGLMPYMPPWDTTNDTWAVGLSHQVLVENSRMKLYNWFRIKDPVTLMFITDSRAIQISGYTSRCDVDIFSKDETAEVVVDCIDPWFYEDSEAENTGGAYARFEFPFSNESLTEPLLEFSQVSIDTRINLRYLGDISVGFNMQFNFSSTEFHNIYIYNMDTRERMTVYTDQIGLLTGKNLTSADDLLISTMSGMHYAYLLRDGKYWNIINAIDKDSDWFKLSKGDNVIAYASDFGVTNIGLSLSYRNAFAGI